MFSFLIHVDSLVWTIITGLARRAFLFSDQYFFVMSSLTLVIKKEEPFCSSSE